MEFFRLSFFLMLIIIQTDPIHVQIGGTSIRVVSFNIRYDNPQDGQNAWQFRKNRIAQFIRFQDADICGLQEALFQQANDLDSLLPEYDWIGVGRDDGSIKGEFCPIFFRKNRFTVMDHGTFWLSETPSEAGSIGWDAALPRIVTWCLIRDSVTGNEIRFFNTHFDHVGKSAREMSVRLLIEKAVEYIGLNPLIITGDFNCTDTSIVYDFLREGGLHDALNISHEPHYGPNSTWNAFTEIEENQRIDFIFVNDLISVRKHAILTDKWDGRFLSDHLPVLAEIVVR